MNYGLPYMGSKNTIAKAIVDFLPASEVFVDLFCGGCAVTHAAMLSGKWKKFVINDIDERLPKLFKDACEGKFKDERRCISRDEFNALKDSDAVVALLWSFGNNGQDYLWNDIIAQAKLQACNIIMAKTWQQRRIEYMKFIKVLQDNNAELERRKASMERLREEYGDIKDGVREELVKYLKESGRTASDIDKMLGTKGMARHYFGKSQWEFPTEEKYKVIHKNCPNFPPFDYWGESLQRLQRLQRLESLQRLQRLQRLESLQRLQRLESLESLQRLQRLQRLESLQRLQSLESLQSLQRLQRLQSLQSLESLESLESLQSLQSLQSLFGSYTNVPIPPNATVYCDPPYKNTNGYSCGAFDHDAFYQWCLTRDFPVYVSEYSMPEGEFTSVWTQQKLVRLASPDMIKNKYKTEHIFVQTKFANCLPTTYARQASEQLFFDFAPK